MKRFLLTFKLKEMVTLIILLLIINIIIGIVLIIAYKKLLSMYYEVSYVGKVLDLILQYAENKYNK